MQGLCLGSENTSNRATGPARERTTRAACRSEELSLSLGQAPRQDAQIHVVGGQCLWRDLRSDQLLQGRQVADTVDGERRHQTLPGKVEMQEWLLTWRPARDLRIPGHGVADILRHHGVLL